MRFALIALACLVAGGIGGIAVAGMRDTPTAPDRFVPPRTVPPQFALRDQDGRRISLRDARGDVLVMTFLYSTCRVLCPAEAQEIRDAVGRAGVRGVQVYGVSVDPVGDTPANVRGFLRRTGLAGAMHFLRGTRSELEPVWRAYGIVPINASPQEARAAAAAFDAQHDAAGPQAAEYAHCPGGAAGYSQYEAASHEGEEHGEEHGCEEDEPPPAAREAYPDTADGRYRGRPRHGSWDFEHTAYVLLVDRHGRQRVGLPFEQLTPARLAQDIRILGRER